MGNSEQIKNRFEKAKECVLKEGLDAWLLVSNENDDINVQYMLGLEVDGRTYIYIPKEGIPHIYAMNYETSMIAKQLTQEGINVKIHPCAVMEDFQKYIPPLLKHHKIAVNYGENIFSSYRGTPYANTMAAGELLFLQTICPTTQFVSAAPIIYALRGIKSSKEIQDFREVVQSTEEILDDLPNWVNIGMTEREVKTKLELEYLKVGIELSFPSIVATQGNAANVHYLSSSQKIGKGCLLIDSGFKQNMMCSDITRTYWVGEQPPADFVDGYQSLYAAKQASYAFMIDGSPLKSPEAKIREVLRARNWDDKKFFFHGLGHSIGYQCHDVGIRPTMSVPEDIVYHTNEVFTNEPGLYKPGKWGMRLEDMVVIGKDYPEVLTHTPKDIIVI